VDIAEDAAGITLTADLPGVKREDLAIGIEGKTLTISAPLSLAVARSGVEGAAGGDESIVTTMVLELPLMFPARSVAVAR
jgi:hypothetical protein